ncbi:MAG: GTPase ObgE, partial [Flavobacteriales bacterium]|nr:GTPase ObgE [Flavobacteriales bacterium]
FVDYVKICCRSGAGGAGYMHFHRDKFTAKGGPDGGDGGRGGHIIMKGNKQYWTLLHLKYRKHVIADDGLRGDAALRHGADGKDEILEVPLGTIARDAETGKIIGEVTEDGQTLILVYGGRGGLGNDHFKSPTRQAPRYAQPGESGVTQWIVLELKVLADVGLVGFPNAGKSTLLSKITAAKPEIGDYPFTTIVPNLGIVPYYDYKSFIVADIPGIIKGAHEGKGLGLRFLRHIERNSVLLFLIPADSKDIREEYDILNNELNAYNPELALKDRLIAITKSDMLDEELMQEIQKAYPELSLMFISSYTGYHLKELKDVLWQLINKPIEA